MCQVSFPLLSIVFCFSDFVFLSREVSFSSILCEQLLYFKDNLATLNSLHIFRYFMEKIMYVLASNTSYYMFSFQCWTLELTLSIYYIQFLFLLFNNLLLSDILFEMLSLICVFTKEPPTGTLLICVTQLWGILVFRETVEH